MIEDKRLKGILTDSIKSLVKNEDLELLTTRKHIVDYLFKRLVEEGAVDAYDPDKEPRSCIPGPTRLITRTYYDVD